MHACWELPLCDTMLDLLIVAPLRRGMLSVWRDAGIANWRYGDLQRGYEVHHADPVSKIRPVIPECVVDEHCGLELEGNSPYEV